MGGGSSLKDRSINTIYESSRYSLDTEWDLFKSYDGKASTIMTASTTIVSIFLAINIFVSDLIKKPISINSPMGYSFLLVLGIIIILTIFTSQFLIRAIWSCLNCLNKVEFIRSPNPIRLAEKYFDKNELSTKISIIKGNMQAWSKNHDFYNVDKAGCILNALGLLKLGIAFLIASLAIDWVIITVYNLYYAGV